ncbi:MAG TPA: IclR family transcriptional regulator [Candidatus Nanopelagicales bacterium]|nr:IclR family transcriptional regulator [Candidatus Nanopelagicales bacterium]
MTALDADRSGRVQSVDRAAALLRAVARSAPAGAPVAELALQCGLNRATAWRLLATLEDNGLVEREPGTGRYVLGLGIARLASAVGVDGLVRRARPVLERLSAASGETADLAVVRPTGLTYVDEVAPATVMAANWLGRNVPLHATSSGKTWLAWLPPREAHTLLSAPLARFTATTLTTLPELDDELTAIRARGYGTCSGEFESQLYGVSAPVLDDGRPVAVISVWGPSDRITEDRFPELGRLVADAADEIAGVLVGAR